MINIEKLQFEGGIFRQISQEIKAEKEINRVLPQYRRSLQRIVEMSDICIKLIETKPQTRNIKLNEEIRDYLIETGLNNYFIPILNSIWTVVPEEVDTITVGKGSFKRDIAVENGKISTEWDIGTVKNHCQTILENLPKRKSFF